MSKLKVAKVRISEATLTWDKDSKESKLFPNRMADIKAPAKPLAFYLYTSSDDMFSFSLLNPQEVEEFHYFMHLCEVKDFSQLEGIDIHIVSNEEGIVFAIGDYSKDKFILLGSMLQSDGGKRGEFLTRNNIQAMIDKNIIVV